VCYSRPKVYTYTANFTRMCSLCLLPVANNHNSGQILTFWGSCTNLCYSRPKSPLTRQISSECVHCVGFRWPKNNFWQILTFGKLLYRPPFIDEGQIWCAIADQWYTLRCQNTSRSVYSVALRQRKTSIFAVFGRLAGG